MVSYMTQILFTDKMTSKYYKEQKEKQRSLIKVITTDFWDKELAESNCINW